MIWYYTLEIPQILRGNTFASFKIFTVTFSGSKSSDQFREPLLLVYPLFYLYLLDLMMSVNIKRDIPRKVALVAQVIVKHLSV